MTPQDDSTEPQELLGFLLNQFMIKLVENPIQRYLLISTVQQEMKRQKILSPQNILLFENNIKIIKHLYKTEGFSFLFKGLLTDISLVPMCFINDIFSQIITNKIMIFFAGLIFNINNFGPVQEILLSVFQASMVSFLNIPSINFKETIITHLHCDIKNERGGSFRFNGAFDCIRRIMRGGNNNNNNINNNNSEEEQEKKDDDDYDTA
eukprot:Tbor_TRINITY_DN5480_c4_g4::TRINITY_DN5480_c4_g4_i1::g.25187::m.25187